MLPEYFAVVGAVIASVGWLYYLYETLKGTSRPNRVTWLFWGILPMITFVAQRVQGVEGVSWATFAAGFVPLLVFAASFYNKAAYWQSGAFDYACTAIVVVGVVLWMVTKEPNTAIACMILADLAAGTPTIIKSAKHPESESARAFGIATFGFGLGVLAIPIWNFQSAAFLVYLLALNGTIALLVSRRTAKSQDASLLADVA